MHLTDTSLHLGSVQANEPASSIRQDFAKVANEAIMTSFYWTEEQGKEKGNAPILPGARETGSWSAQGLSRKVPSSSAHRQTGGVQACRGNYAKTAGVVVGSCSI